MQCSEARNTARECDVMEIGVGGAWAQVMECGMGGETGRFARTTGYDVVPEEMHLHRDRGIATLQGSGASYPL